MSKSKKSVTINQYAMGLAGSLAMHFSDNSSTTKKENIIAGYDKDISAKRYGNNYFVHTGELQSYLTPNFVNEG
jgi:hypothetical protein